MEAQDRTERESEKNSICRLEWIAWAMDAARRHKEAEQLGLVQPEREVQPSGDE
jgi:hypothetical protein